MQEIQVLQREFLRILTNKQNPYKIKEIFCYFFLVKNFYEFMLF